MLNKITQHIRTKTVTLATVSTLSLLLTACGGSNSSTTNTQPQPDLQPVVQPTTGIWNAPAYGLVVDIQQGSHTFYQTTSDYCQRFNLGIIADYTHADLLASIALSDDQDSMVTTIAGEKVPGMTMTRQTALPDSCMSNPVSNQGETGYVYNPQQDFEIFWQTFQQYYAFFELENVDWDSIYQSANSQISQSTSPQELFTIFSDMVTPLKDFHVNLISPQLEQEFSLSRKQELSDILVMEFIAINNIEAPYTEDKFVGLDVYFEQQFEKATDALLSHAANPDEVKSNATETMTWAKTVDNVGYLMVETMDIGELGNEDASKAANLQALKATMVQVIADFAGAEGIIVDVRNNGGGDDFVSQTIVSYLIDQDLNAYSKQVRLGDERTPQQHIVITPADDSQFTGPVAVLTSTTTSSAAEIFSMAMRARPNTVLVGEATGGGFSDILPKTLPHGLMYTLSNEIYLSHDGQEFEGAGVPVDIEQPYFTLEQREAGQDLGLDKAIDWVKSLRSIK